ncbi:MAG: endolytic transglycosylase MltG [Alphaproteobacteria bacterium]
MNQPISPRRSKSKIVFLALFLALAALPSFGLWALFVSSPIQTTKTLIIPHGTSIREIAALLHNDNVISSPLAFRIGTKIISHDQLKAGEYEFTPGQTTADIVLMMHEGRSVVHMLTIAEGLTSAEIIKNLKDLPQFTGEVAIPPDGSLLPETYQYTYGDSRSSIVARMQKSMQDLLATLWTQRDPSLPIKTPEEAVVMASIIEKETGIGTERARIAGVFYNRLRKNMRLQSDPTVIYAITQSKGPMTRDLIRDDLTFASPYNTYASDGLPPQPICNPGKAALQAALHPEQNDFIYFVADGTGGHAFARDLAEHNQNVIRWNQIKVKTP